MLASPLVGELIVITTARPIPSTLDPLPTRSTHPRHPPTRQPRQGRGAPTGFARRDPAVRHRPGRRPRVRPERVPHRARPLLDGKADVVFGSRFMGGDAHTGALLLAHRGQPVPHARVEHVRPTSTSPTWRRATRRSVARCSRHHDRGGPVRLRAGDHREDRRAGLPHLRGRHQLLTGARTTRARRSAGATVFGRSSASPPTRGPVVRFVSGEARPLVARLTGF